MDYGIIVPLLHSLSDKYSWERYEPSYPPSYGLNSTTTVLLEGWLWHLLTYKGWYAIKQKKPNQTKKVIISRKTGKQFFDIW